MKPILEETYLDRTGWRSGPWDEEPDKIHWIDEVTDLDCLVVRSVRGHLCGYIACPPGHPWHGKDYTECDVDCHGGLTFSDFCQQQGGKICHVPEPGRPHDVWWLGFDCAHAWDISPSRSIEWEADQTYKRVGYVIRECETIAKQVKEAANES